MACPAIAGSAALVRQYYMEGFHPSGAATPADAFTPTGALLRATLLNGTVDMTGIDGYPSNEEGWGRLLLENVLHFAGDGRGLLAWDVRHSDGLLTSDSLDFDFEVAGTAPLKVTLAFTDAPAAENAAYTRRFGS